MNSEAATVVRLALITVPVALVYSLLCSLDDWFDALIPTLITLLLGAALPSTAHAATLARLYCGSFVSDIRKRPLKHLILFDCELDPACMPIRECLSVLDATVEVYPVPRVDRSKSLMDVPLQSRFEAELRRRSRTGSAELPYLEDPNTQIVLQGSTDDILLYLFTAYARKGATRAMPAPLGGKGGGRALAQVACALRSVVQPYGLYAQPSVPNRQPLKLYAYEGCSESRTVRERLCSLQLHYQMVTCAQGGTGRVQLVHQLGQLVTPVLFDPATNRILQGSAACVRYLISHYDRAAISRARQEQLQLSPREDAAGAGAARRASSPGSGVWVGGAAAAGAAGAAGDGMRREDGTEEEKKAHDKESNPSGAGALASVAPLMSS